MDELHTHSTATPLSSANVREQVGYLSDRVFVHAMYDIDALASFYCAERKIDDGRLVKVMTRKREFFNIVRTHSYYDYRKHIFSLIMMSMAKSDPVLDAIEAMMDAPCYIDERARTVWRKGVKNICAGIEELLKCGILQPRSP